MTLKEIKNKNREAVLCGNCYIQFDIFSTQNPNMPRPDLLFF